jgi:hypothetical protein
MTTSAIVGAKGTIPADLVNPPTESEPWDTSATISITGETVNPRDPSTKIPDPFTITVNAETLQQVQRELVTTAQQLLGKPSTGAPAYAFGGEGAQHGGTPLPQLLIKAGNANFLVMQPSGNHIDLARCAVDMRYCTWIKAVFAAARMPLLSVSVHMDAYFLMSATHVARAREILGGTDAALPDERLQELLLQRMALIMIGAARLGIQALHLFWGQPGNVPPYGWPFHPAGGTNIREMRERFVAIMKRLLPLAEQLGIYLCHEIHFGTIAQNADDYITIWEMLGKPKHMVLGFDPSHFWCGEPWYIALDKLRRAGIKVILCHFKQAIILHGRAMLGYEHDDRLRGMMFVSLDSTGGFVDMNLYAGQLTLPGTGLAEFWHGQCDLPIPGYAEAEDPHWNTWDVLARGVEYLQRTVGRMHLAGAHFTAEMKK